MGIFSFGKKDEAPARRGANRSTRSTRAERSERTERVERRTRRTERPAEADAMLLDPTLPEKQRARRRLVGAIALVVAAIVILPMVLDSHPKPVTDDIAIDIPNRPAPGSPRASTSDEDVQAGVAPDNPAAPEGAVASAPAAPAAPVAAASKTAQAAAASSPSAKPGATRNQSALANATPSAPAPAQSKPSAKDKAPAAQTQSATAANADSGNPSAPPGARFAVQLGAFKDDVNARSWVTKLKAAGVPAYTERRKQADGSMLTLVRAGPFADRAAASAAIAKVRDAGLTSGANNGSAQ